MSWKVLLVDDHERIRQALSTLLSHLPGVEMHIAEDGEQAVEIAARIHPELVLMDILMPGVSGMEATRRILSESPQSQIVGLTACIDPEVLSEAREAGMVEILDKSTRAMEMVERVRSLLPAGTRS